MPYGDFSPMLRLVLAIAALALISAEFAARAIGLGSPPLFVAHPTIEYMFAPKQDLVRFGRRILVNEWSMRSGPVEKVKPNGEQRILALGDSVLNGGAATDHSELATTLLSSGSMHVLNVSVGSWGPGNMLAYIKSFGLFDADMTIIVLSSHDAYDVPTFVPLNPVWQPTDRPVSALYEGLVRYLPLMLPDVPGWAGTRAQAGMTPEQDAIPALVELLSLVSRQGPVCVILHSTRTELRSGKPDRGRAEIEAAARAAKASIVSASEFMNIGQSYRDDIHLNATGQRHLGQAFGRCLDGAGFSSVARRSP